MRPRRTAAYLALALAAVGGPAGAEPPGAPDAGLEVTVRGESAGAYASRVSVDDSVRPPTDAASLLEELPGVHVRRLGAEGSLATLSVRGSASSQVGVYLAGIPLTSGADPSFDVGALPLWPGASFRVYRGFAPASLGTTGYLGGVLAVEPPSSAVGERTTWWAGAGSFGALKLRLGDVRRVGDVTLGTGLFASRSDGDFSYELADPISGRARTLARANAGYVAVGGIERASVELPWGSVGALIFAHVRRQGLPGAARYPTTVARLEAARVALGLDATARTGAHGALRALVWGRRDGTSLADPRGELDPLRRSSRAEYAIEATGGSVGWRGRPLDPLALGVAVDARGERFTPDAQQASQVSARRLAGGVGADAEWRAAPITIAATARLDARRDAAEAALAGAGGPSAELAPRGHVGASLALAPAAVISAHAGALRRSPGFTELHGDLGSLRGDPSLRPERALSVDAGLHGDVGDGGFQLGYELVGFATAAEDIIAFLPLGRSTFRAENLDPHTLLGAELSFTLATRAARTSLSYALLHTRNTGDDPLTQGRPLPGRPAHDLTYNASWRFGPVALRYGLDAIAGTTVDEGATIVLPPRVLHGVGASLDVPGAPGLRAAVDVDNLLDLRTGHVPTPLRPRAEPLPLSDFLGFPLPGRAVWVSLRWTAPRGAK